MILSWVSLAGLLLACPVFGQAGKLKMLDEADYGLWSTMRLDQVSDEGNFVSYHLDYPSGADTLFVMGADGKRKLALPHGRDGRFFKNDHFACLKGNGGMALHDLRSGSITGIDGVEAYHVLGNGTLLLVKDGGKTLEIVDGSGKTIQHVEDVNAFAVSPGKDKIAVSTTGKQNGVFLITPDAGTPFQVVKSGTACYSNLYWDATGERFAFCSGKSGDEQRIEALHLFSCTIRKLTDKTLEGKDGAFSVFDLALSPDGKRVGLKTFVPETDNPTTASPEVWDAKDPVPFPARAKLTKMGVWVWDVDKQTFAEVTDGLFSQAVMGSALDFAIVENPLAHLPSYKFEPDRDLFVKNIHTGAIDPLVAGLPGQMERVAFTPDGSGICYFDRDNWLLYDLNTKQTRNLTDGLGVLFGDQDNDRPEPNRPYALPIWSKDGKTVYLYDKFDIWAIGEKGRKRITKGRERSLVLRFAEAGLFNPDALVASCTTVDDQKPVWLSAVADDHSVSGFYLFERGSIRPLVLIGKAVSRLQVSKDGKRAFWTEEDFDLPPQIVMMDVASQKKKILFSSNAQQRRFAWGHSQLITYRNSKGKPINGTLYYPAGYDPAKRYPMVVHVYERQTAGLHLYRNPRLNEGSGFNRTHFTLQGYFVLCPDIWFTIGDPGASAVDCTESAVREVLRMVPVDAERVGLIGHSMGGYLVNFIVTHSSMFRAAVSGAANSDTTSGYFTMGANTRVPEFARFECDQMRMGKPFFDDKDAYRRNSPIEFARQMDTPLLQWTGADDTQVAPWQSMEFHMALRRLGKESELLIYPGEDHVLSQRSNQIDLTRRIEAWFRKYLKP